MRRKKYDTEALVGQLKSERRSGILITFGVLILGGLGALYFTGVGKDEIPEVPHDGTATAEGAAVDTDAAKPGAKPETKAEEKVAGVTPEPAADKPPSIKSGTVHISAPKKGVMLFMNDQKMKVSKKKDVSLPPGKHVFKTKFGKKTVTQEIEVESGGDYTLTIDPKKKKLTLK